MKCGDNPQTVDFDDKSSLKICSICKKKKVISDFTKNQRKNRNPFNIKCKSCSQKLQLSPNYIIYIH